MKGTETGKDKIQKICDALKRETLEPALLEAEEIIAAAKQQAEKLIAQAQKEAVELKQEAVQEIARQKNVFEASLSQACKQSMAALRQSIEEKLFNKELSRLVTEETSSPHVLAEMISAIIKGVEKEGVTTAVSAYIPAAVPARAVNALLAQGILGRLREHGVLLEAFGGGVTVKLHEQQMTLELTDRALEELVARYIRKDFRALLFGSPHA